MVYGGQTPIRSLWRDIIDNERKIHYTNAASIVRGMKQVLQESHHFISKTYTTLEFSSIIAEEFL